MVATPYQISLRDTIKHRHARLYQISFVTTGWRRPTGCLKLQGIFRKRATNYRALLRKMTYEDKASYDSTPPCMKYC